MTTDVFNDSSSGYGLTAVERARYEKHPHRREGVLRAVYWGHGLSTTQAADALDCGETTVRLWLKRHDIPRRLPRGGVEAREAAREANRVEHAALHEKRTDGRERWHVNDVGGEQYNVPVAQLVAVAEGEDPSKVFGDEHETHHRNGVPWDDRPQNLSVLTREEHADAHAAEPEHDAELGLVFDPDTDEEQ